MEKYKKSNQKNKWKRSAPTWYEESELSDGSYFALDMQDYFVHIIKKHDTLTDKPPIEIYVNKI